jgi:flagellar hook protein FlgE
MFQFYADYDGSAATTSTADRQLITLDLGTIGFGDGMTQYAGDYYPSIIEQDGLAFGAFTGITISDQGIVTALFDNGQLRDIFQLPIATFRNPNGLEARNGNAYLQTERSGDALLLQANTGGAGEVAPSSLESSTVDLAEEFTNMIITQRAYSASAKIITTADEMLEELIRIRR